MAGKEGKKNRKYGKNATYCKVYAAAGLRAKHRLRRMRRHIRAHPRDVATRQWYLSFGGTEGYLERH